MHDIWHGTLPGLFVSMGVISDGSYGAPKDVIFSFPVVIENKEWKIAQVSHTCLINSVPKSLLILPIDTTT